VEGTEDQDVGAAREHQSRRFTGAEALRSHLTLLVGLGLCGLAFWFELGRAEGGNELSWAYVFEWPLLAVFAIYMWWKVLDPERQSRVTTKRRKELAPEFHGMLSAWQEHQRDLAGRNRDHGADEHQSHESEP
jgi:hypothetical protein